MCETKKNIDRVVKKKKVPPHDFNWEEQKIPREKKYTLFCCYCCCFWCWGTISYIFLISQFVIVKQAAFWISTLGGYPFNFGCVFLIFLTGKYNIYQKSFYCSAQLKIFVLVRSLLFLTQKMYFSNFFSEKKKFEKKNFWVKNNSKSFEEKNPMGQTDLSSTVIWEFVFFSTLKRKKWGKKAQKHVGKK